MRRGSGGSTCCSGEIDWIADERGELQRPYKHLKDEEHKGTADCLLHKKGNSLKRSRRWSQEEDGNLIQMVNLHSSKSWSTVARGIPGRSPNQCRDRWMFYLDPSVNNQPWSEHEDIKLIQAHKIHGSKWSKLAKLFPGRTGKAVKNHWPSLMRKQMKSDLISGLPEQFLYMPKDQSVTKNKGCSTIQSDQDSSTNIHVSSDSAVRPKSEQGLADERGELQRPSKHLKDEEYKRTADCLPHKKGNSLKRSHRWSQEESYSSEDDNLIQMVNLHSSKSWSTVARGIPGRSPIQCRDRWMFYLDPAVNNQPWSEHEDIKLIQAHEIHGSKWCKLAKLFPGRTGKAVKNHWPSLLRKQMKSDLVSGLPEQFPYIPKDPSVTKSKGSSTFQSDQDSSINIHVSSDSAVRPKPEQGIAENGRNESTLKGTSYDSVHGNGSVSHSVNVSEKVDGQIFRSNSLSCMDQKASSATGSFPGSLPKEESTNFLEVTPNRGLCTTYDHLSNDCFDGICSSADRESQELHLSSIAYLLDMPYCKSLMIVPPDSPDHGNYADGM